MVKMVGCFQQIKQAKQTFQRNKAIKKQVSFGFFLRHIPCGPMTFAGYPFHWEQKFIHTSVTHVKVNAQMLRRPRIYLGPLTNNLHHRLLQFQIQPFSMSIWHWWSLQKKTKVLFLEPVTMNRTQNRSRLNVKLSFFNTAKNLVNNLFVSSRHERTIAQQKIRSRDLEVIYLNNGSQKN